MSKKSLSEKLLIKPGRTFLVIDPPGELKSILPNGEIQVSHKGDVLLVFIQNQDDLLTFLSGMESLVNPGGIVWIAYPKLTSRQKSNANRDLINAEAKQKGWIGIAMIAIDETWSALRIKPQ